MKRVLTTLAGVLSAIALSAQQPTLRSGIELANLDKSVRPQDDLYRAANGAWIASAQIPPDRPTIGAGTELADRAEADVRAIIEECATVSGLDAPGSTRQLVGDLYRSLMDESRANQLGAAPLAPMLKRIDSLQSTSELAALIGELSAIGLPGPIGGYVAADSHRPDVAILYLRQGGTLLPDREFYVRNEGQFLAARAGYLEFLRRMLTLAGRPDAAVEATNALALETEFAKLQWSQADSRDTTRTYNNYVFNQFAIAWPGFEWEAWAKPQGFGGSSEVVVMQPSFFRAFAAMVSRTPLATWRAWLAAQYIAASAPYLSQPFVDAAFDFFGKTLTGQTTPSPRSRRATQFVTIQLGDAVGKLYVARHLPPAALARVRAIVSNVVATYQRAITDTGLFAQTSKVKALSKLAAMGLKIGYPDRWREYDGLRIVPDDALGNVQRVLKFENDFQIARMGKPITSGDWLLTPQTPNAGYNPLLNDIQFPAAMLQPPFFRVDADEAVNYGAIGAMIAHEIGHAFDNVGGHYDVGGKLRNWWTPFDSQQFTSRAEALVQQVNQRTVDGRAVDGMLTVGENFADLGGLEIAFKAYERSLGGATAPTLDGYTGPQRFFLGWAQAWRAKDRPEYARQMLLNNPRAPAPVRTNNTVSNMTAFYEAFDVKSGDKLYRGVKERVKIW